MESLDPDRQPWSDYCWELYRVEMMLAAVRASPLGGRDALTLVPAGTQLVLRAAIVRLGLGGLTSRCDVKHSTALMLFLVVCETGSRR